MNGSDSRTVLSRELSMMQRLAQPVNCPKSRAELWVRHFVCKQLWMRQNSWNASNSCTSENVSTFKYAVFLFALIGSDEDSLRRLGKILHLSNSRSLIVRCDESLFVKIGTKVCDTKLKEIGRVQDLFGPVTSPYVAVRPTVSSPAKFVHRIAYYFD